MEKLPVWEEKITVRSHETDFRGRWKPAGFFAAMQEAATHHAAHLGFDYPDMIANNQIWLLSRLKIRFDQFPTVSQPVTVRTWPKGIRQKIMFLRDFEFWAASGERLAAATSVWLLIDVQNRRLLQQSHLQGQLPLNEGLSALAEDLEKINPPEDLPALGTAQGSYANVDMMGHVNNTRYVDWISDLFSFETYAAQRLAWLQINYVNEVKPAERVTLYAGQQPGTANQWWVDSRSDASGQRAFEASLCWTPEE